MRVVTGFHAVEERVRRAEESKNIQGMSVHIAKSGPRIKKIAEIAKRAGISVVESDMKNLDAAVRHLPEVAREHRGIVLFIEGESSDAGNETDFEQWIKEAARSNEKSVVVVLDSVTDPHNVGAIIRSCDQFGADLVVLPARNGANDFKENEIIARSSAGASAYVKISVVTNLVRAVQQLKNAGFWIYGADAGGTDIRQFDYSGKTAVVMGSEGKGIARLLKEQCDSVVSIPTCGKIDSLNVSVAAGVILYEIYRKSL